MNTMMTVPNDMRTIMKLSGFIRILNLLKAALTVGIIAFTVFRIIGILKISD